MIFNLMVLTVGLGVGTGVGLSVGRNVGFMVGRGVGFSKKNVGGVYGLNPLGVGAVGLLTGGL